MIDITLIIPAYNEGFRIIDTMHTVSDYMKSLGMTYEIIVVNDGSTDDTLERLNESFSQREDIHIINYSPNKGKGNAIKVGVLASRGELVAFSDADLSAPITELAKLLDAVKDGADIAIGSRAVKDSELVVRQPFYRELGGRGLNLIIQLLAVWGIHDTQCGFKLFKGDAGRYIFERTIVDSWGFDVEFLYLARKMGLRIDEIAVRWAHGEGSKIKNPLKAGIGVVRDILRIRFNKYELDK